VNAAQAYIAYLQLSIVPRRDFRCQVPLPAVGKVLLSCTLGSRTSRDKVERIRRVKGWAIERALSPVPIVNGGFAPTSRVLVPLIGSRVKNCPTPRAGPNFHGEYVHAKPTRGAIRWLLEGIMLRFLE